MKLTKGGWLPLARKKLETLTEQMFYVLLVLRQERHGYGIMQSITALTNGRVNVGAGTLYALLERFEKDGLILLTHPDGTQPEILSAYPSGRQGASGRVPAHPPAGGGYGTGIA